jgi:fermentation-respiration switch protein FrsA (DUF1100 family)
VQARFLTRAYVEGFAGGVTSIAWFALRDWDSTNPGFQIFLETGLVKRDWTPKPSLNAMKTLRSEVGRRAFLRRLDAGALGGDGIDGYAFGPPNAPVWALWSRAEAPQTVTLPGRGPARALDMLGAPVALSGSTLTIGPNPVYLEFAATP